LIVRHSKWGIGKVIGVSAQSAVIRFPSLVGSEGGPCRKIVLTAPQVTVSREQKSPELDAIPMTCGKASGPGKPGKGIPIVVNTLEESLAWFKSTYPGLFPNDSDLRRQELDAKRAAQQRFAEAFGEGHAKKLLKKGALGTIIKELDYLYRATKIPSQYEMIAMHEALNEDPGGAGNLLDRVLSFIDAPAANTFEVLVDAVEALPRRPGGARVRTWPTVTLIPFLANPTSCMVLKPEIAKRMAARMKVNLLYSSTPKWHCYVELLRMSDALLGVLKPLGARDYIDVQSFMWVTRKLP
jgi:hypothetical protein